MAEPAVLWLRRDLRRADHPALGQAHATAGDAGVYPLFVIDPKLWESCGPVRRRWLAETLRATADAYDGKLTLRVGDPAQAVPRFVEQVSAGSVHVTRETTPYGARRDRQVAARLAESDVELVETGTPYAIGPGILHTGSNTPFQVFTPFSRAWREHGWPAPAQTPDVQLHRLDDHERAGSMIDKALTADRPAELPDAGEEAALARWREFAADVADYDEDRDRPDRDGTSRMSPYLKLGVVHPRTLLADLASARSKGAETFRTELAWRDFYADVLFHHPTSAWADLKSPLRGMTYDEPDELVDAWREGRTGYPIVDAGMRQLLATGWMHNRVRMITASFLTKDLHVWWPVGARHFLDHLIDGDIASNNHGWQWVAGTGTDASPYFRVFNPITQGQRFDPHGDYVRHWVPELRHLTGKSAHEPWKSDGGYARDYPQRIVDHADERTEALARYDAVRR